MTLPYSKIITPAFIILLCFALCSCSGKGRKTNGVVELDKKVEVESVLVLAVDLPSAGPVDEGKEPEALTEGTGVLSSILESRAESLENLIFMPRDKMESMLSGFSGTEKEKVLYLSRETKADAVLQTQISRYVKRAGGKYSVSQPASVSFSYQLLHTPTGDVLCKGRYMETQEPLFSNLFAFFKAAGRGFKWITAEELLREGVEQVFAECVYLGKE